MQVLFDFDENQSAQKALEIIAKQLGGQVISSGKVEKHEGSRMFVKIEMPRDTEVDGILIRFANVP